MSEYMLGISHVCLPCFFVQRLCFLPQLFPVLQLSDSSECCVFRVSTVRPIETDCCCCCCCWHPRVWCYCWDDFRCNWNLDISGVLQFLFSCKHTRYDTTRYWTLFHLCRCSFHASTLDMIRQDIELCFTCAVALFKTQELAESKLLRLLRKLALTKQ